MPRKYAPKKSYPDSFCVKIGGSGNAWSEAEFRAMLMQVADYIFVEARIPFVKPARIYINPVDEKSQPIIRVLGQPLSDIVIPGPYRSAADEHGV
jgi:hypothetical protein